MQKFFLIAIAIATLALTGCAAPSYQVGARFYPTVEWKVGDAKCKLSVDVRDVSRMSRDLRCW